MRASRSGCSGWLPKGGGGDLLAVRAARLDQPVRVRELLFGDRCAELTRLAESGAVAYCRAIAAVLYKVQGVGQHALAGAAQRVVQVVAGSALRDQPAHRNHLVLLVAAFELQREVRQGAVVFLAEPVGLATGPAADQYHFNVHATQPADEGFAG